MIELIQGDCVEVMQGMEKNVVDTILTDPPYGISFMQGKINWDAFSDGQAYQEWTRLWAVEALRVVKPGAIMLCFGGTRMFHREMCGIEDAGWKIMDTIMWLYSTGFPHSYSIEKGIDKHFKAEREVVGISTNGKRTLSGSGIYRMNDKNSLMKKEFSITAPASEQAKLWEGYGTCLAPSYEPIIVAMKPRDGTYVENALNWGVAGYNITGARIPVSGSDKKGRWPKNVILDEGAAQMLDEQTGGIEQGGFVRNRTDGARPFDNDGKDTGYVTEEVIEELPAGKSRFYYCPKASKAERNLGCDGLEDKDCGVGALRDGGRNNTRPAKNNHVSVKPLALMEYLCTLTRTPTGGVVLDPFLGSGSTAIACINTDRDCIGIELEEDNIKISEARANYFLDQKNLDKISAILDIKGDIE